MYQRLGGFQITTSTIPAGDPGTVRTLAMMRQLAQDGATRLEVRNTAVAILRASHVAPHDQLGAVRAIFEWVKRRILFVNDIAGVETLQAPHYTLAVGAGDCDDRATLIASLLRAVGISSTFRAVGTDPNNPRRFSHVYVAAQVPGGPVAMDTTYGSNALGWEPSRSRFLETPA